MKTYQPKVSATQKYSDNQGEYLVHEGKLIFMDVNFLKDQNYIYLTTPTGERCVKSIIISETEEIEVGDLVYHKRMFTTGVTGIYKAVDKRSNEDFKFVFIDDPSIFYYATKSPKILALPEHFSDKHLQAIVDGKMKEGKVLLKCSGHRNFNIVPDDSNQMIHGYLVSLNQQNHITLFRAKQSLEEVAEQLCPNYTDSGQSHWKDGFKKGAEWAKKNNY